MKNVLVCISVKLLNHKTNIHVANDNHKKYIIHNCRIKVAYTIKFIDQYILKYSTQSIYNDTCTTTISS